MKGSTLRTDEAEVAPPHLCTFLNDIATVRHVQHTQPCMGSCRIVGSIPGGNIMAGSSIKSGISLSIIRAVCDGIRTLRTLVRQY